MIEKKLQDEIIEKNRNFTKGYRDDAPAYEEDLNPTSSFRNRSRRL